VDPIGHSGGIVLFWMDSREIEIFNFSRFHINAIVKGVGGSPDWMITGFYGQPDCSKSYETWDLLLHLKLLFTGPWLVLGDFNEILDHGEKLGRVLRREAQINVFQLTLEDCGLSDLGFFGPKFTWRNNREGDDYIEERIDRAVANSSWLTRFTWHSIEVMDAITSDHNPILLKFNEDAPVTCPSRTGRYGKKFEASWTFDPEWKQVMSDSWVGNFAARSPLSRVHKKLLACQHDLSTWSWHKFGNDQIRLQQKNKELILLQSRVPRASSSLIKILQTEIDKILACEDIHLKQRAKQNWYRFGDRNTKYFHSWAKQRKKVNSISSIMDRDGRIWKKKCEISKAFLSYYEDLFTTQRPAGVEHCLLTVNNCVTDEMNGTLLQPFSRPEVEVALHSMHHLKSPGPDGFSAGFYQQAWDTIGDEVSSSVLSFLNGSSFNQSINATNIVLIPKVSNPSLLTEYRPISLCNVFYKIIAKVLANRLKGVLTKVVSKEQSAFIKGCLITDNILVAFETLHTMDSRLKGKEGFMALKLDMSKAYDRVE